MNIYFHFISFIFGLVFGSFGNAWAWRIVHNESIVKGRSHCAVCNHELSVLDLFPLFSWLFLKGKCRYCGSKISIRYPTTELILGLTFLIIFHKYSFTLDTIRYLILFFLLFVASLVDFDTMELPDGLLIAAYLASLLRLPDWKSILIGTFAISVPVLIIVIIMDKILGKESFGGGDIKLLAVLGAHFGAANTLFLIIVSCIIGIVFAVISKKGKGNAFPFGPILSIGALITCIFGTEIVIWYISLF